MLLARVIARQELIERLELLLIDQLGRHVQAIRADLAWLGLDVDGEERQSARFNRYEAALARLAEAGRAYPAYETAQELELKRKVALGRGLPPIYDRAALALGDADRAALEAETSRTPTQAAKVTRMVKSSR